MPATDGRLKLPRPLSSEPAAGPQAFLELSQRLSAWERGGTTAERDAFYGIPTTEAERIALEGAEWKRTDTGWTERYFRGDSSSNPRGAYGAGTPGLWLPVAGVLPNVQVTNVPPNNAEANPNFTTRKTGFTQGTIRSKAGMGVANSAVTVPLPGVYGVSFSGFLGADSGGRVRGMRINSDAGVLATETRRWVNPDGTGGAVPPSTHVFTLARPDAVLLGGQTVWVEAVQDSSGTRPFECIHFSLAYQGPA